MSYYTERHGMRKPIPKSYTITIEMYSLLFRCCKKYYNNIAWKYPEQCRDGYGCCGLDYQQFDENLRYEIPSLFRDEDNQVVVPRIHYNVFSNEREYDEYDQYSLLDFIEFFAINIRDVEQGSYHSYFGHYHLILKDSCAIFKQFQSEINDIFRKTGLLYKLTDEKIIERIVENSPLTPEIEKQVTQIKEKGTRELLEEAIALYRQPYPSSTRDAVEKIWDALERLKTYYTNLDKKASAAKIVSDISNGDTVFIDLFNEEFRKLTVIGNNFRIRHHETNKVEITDTRHYDYFFNRCLSLIALAIQYLQ